MQGEGVTCSRAGWGSSLVGEERQLRQGKHENRAEQASRVSLLERGRREVGV